MELRIKKIELNNRTGIFFALHTAIEWNLLSFSVEQRENLELIRSRSVNYPITTLLFVGAKNTMMAPLLYIFISSVVKQSQSFFLIRKIRKKIFLYSFKHK